MGDVVSINTKKFLGGYCSAQEQRRFPEDGFFLTGVVLTVVVPQIAYCANGGPISPWVFVAGAAAGTILGLIKFNRPVAVVASCVGARTAQVPRDGSIPRRKRL